MIQEDPKLPRLSRSEIVDILFNITSKDVQNFTDQESIDKARLEYQRALMVVLPYSSNASHENLKELYTKPPMVQMVPDANEAENDETIYDNGESEEVVYPEKFDESSLDSPLNNYVASENVDQSNSRDYDTDESTGSYENHRDTYSEVVDPLDFKTSLSGGGYNRGPVYDKKPERFSFNLNHLQMTPKSTMDPVLSSKAPEDFEDSLPTDSKLQIVYSTTVTTKKPTTAQTDQEQSTESTTHRHVLTSGQWHYNAPPTTTETPMRVYPEYKFHTETVSQPSTTSTSTTTRKPEVKIPVEGQNSEKNYEDHTLYVMEAEKPSPMYVTPMSPNTNVAKTKFSSSYSANNGPSMPPMRSEVKELLASIGLSEGNPDPRPDADSSVPIAGSNDLISDQISGLDSTGIGAPSILSQNTFENINYQPNNKGTQNLTPDIQLLLQRFGLPTSKQAELPSTTTKKPTPIVVNLNSYSSFRPLPSAKVEDEDMKDFLAKFGLGTDKTEKSRGHKSIKTRKNAEANTPSLIEAVPDSMKKILENIGLITRSQKSVEVKSTSYSSAPKLHVFKPHEAPVHTDEQKEKINKLLDTVKKVQAGTADSNDVKTAAKDLLESTKTLQNGPDPISLGEILSIYNEGIKNEVKRQEEATTTEDDSAAATPLATGIQKLMLYVLGTSEFWVGKMIQGLTRIKTVLTKASNKLRVIDGD